MNRIQHVEFSTHRSPKRLRRLMVAVIVTVAAVSRPALAYDAAADFSTNNNPNGVWSYGQSTSLGSSFLLYDSDTAYSNGFPFLRWHASSITDPNVGVFYNTTTNFTLPWTFQTLGANQIAEHPGPSGEYALVRFTAPSSGSFSISNSFFGADANAGGTDVHVLRNNVSIFNGNVTGYYVPLFFSTNLVLTIGDTIDFAVGYGSDHTYFDDLTGVTAIIVPEPTTFLLVGAGAAYAALSMLNRKNRTRAGR